MASRNRKKRHSNPVPRNIKNLAVKLRPLKHWAMQNLITKLATAQERLENLASLYPNMTYEGVGFRHSTLTKSGLTLDICNKGFRDLQKIGLIVLMRRTQSQRDGKFGRTLWDCRPLLAWLRDNSSVQLKELEAKDNTNTNTNSPYIEELGFVYPYGDSTSSQEEEVSEGQRIHLLWQEQKRFGDLPEEFQQKMICRDCYEANDTNDLMNQTKMNAEMDIFMQANCQGEAQWN